MTSKELHVHVGPCTVTTAQSCLGILVILIVVIVLQVSDLMNLSSKGVTLR